MRCLNNLRRLYQNYAQSAAMTLALGQHNWFFTRKNLEEVVRNSGAGILLCEPIVARRLICIVFERIIYEKSPNSAFIACFWGPSWTSLQEDSKFVGTSTLSTQLIGICGQKVNLEIKWRSGNKIYSLLLNEVRKKRPFSNKKLEMRK